MPENSYTPTIDLWEVNTRANIAQHIVLGFARVMPNLGEFWQDISDSLSDIPLLAAEISRLGSTLTACRLDRANLAAAARAALAAHRDGQPDPWWFLRDELAAQGFTIQRRPA